MGRMRVEKKWRQAREEKKRGVDPDSDRRIGSLTGDDKLAAINAAGRDMWDKSVMRAALSIWGDQMPADMDEDEAAWRREELEAQMAEMAAEEEEKEAEAAEALYNKEEREAVEAERALARSALARGLRPRRRRRSFKTCRSIPHHSELCVTDSQ